MLKFRVHHFFNFNSNPIDLSKQWLKRFNGKLFSPVLRKLTKKKHSTFGIAQKLFNIVLIQLSSYPVLIQVSRQVTIFGDADFHEYTVHIFFEAYNLKFPDIPVRNLFQYKSSVTSFFYKNTLKPYKCLYM